MRTCEFCGRETRYKHCSAICTDAAVAAEVSGAELGPKNCRLIDYIRLKFWLDGNYGFMRIRHTLKENE